MESSSSSSVDDGDYSSDENYDQGGKLRQPYLFRLLHDGDWSEALSRIRSHRHEAQFTGCDSDRTSALLVALSDGVERSSETPPVGVVRAIIAAGGDNFVLHRNAVGATALHLAVATRITDPAMNEVIRTILRSEVGGARGSGVLAEIETHDGLTPLGVFRSVWIDSASSQAGSAALEQAMEGEASASEDLTGGLRVLWDRAVILLRATAGGDVVSMASEEHDRLMLHRVVSSPVTMPTSFVNLAIRLCSDQGWERDSGGRIPLALAAMCPGSKYGCSRTEWLYPLHALTETCPSSASMADCDGRLPLHLALESGYRTWETGIETILIDAPRALSTRDVKTHLYPFQMAAVDTKTDLTTVFLLLRQNPMLAWGLAADSLWVKTTKLQSRVQGLERENAELKKENSEQMRENQRLRLEAERLRSQIASMEAGTLGAPLWIHSHGGKSSGKGFIMDENFVEVPGTNEKRHAASKRRKQE